MPVAKLVIQKCEVWAFIFFLCNWSISSNSLNLSLLYDTIFKFGKLRRFHFSVVERMIFHTFP